MNESAPKPSAGQRLAALASVILVAIVLVYTAVVAVNNFWQVLAQLALLGVAALATWRALTRTGGARALAIAIGAAALVVFIAIGVGKDMGGPVSVVVRIGLLLLGMAAAKYALGRTETALKQSETAGTPVPASIRGVLIMNLKSGGGKAERFHLEDECRKRGIEPVVLKPGDDLLELARDAADRSADVIGMAGGDGSQALVASVAAERGIPMVVVPAGTRNHLALDLGLDREDVVGGLDAFGEARERKMDLADVNGKVFVNNVSLGLYAAIVRSPEYRDAKRDTTLSALPKVLGPGTEPFDLRFTGPDGNEHRGAHLIQISNNPYGSTVTGLGSRPRLDTRLLGIITVEIRSDREASEFLAAIATGRPDRFSGFMSWSAPTFEVTSDSPIDVGLDGETLQLESPLRFSIRPDPLRVRLSTHAIGYSPAALAMGWGATAQGLWHTLLGKPVPLEP
jgi:diacylglycerol kinase family enzyme